MLTSERKVFSSGSNEFGELGLGHRESTFYLTQIDLLNDYDIKKLSCCLYSSALSLDGRLFVWGTCPYGEYLNPVKVEIS
jgi:alpha-tubulin suppressor-like RCC1 family protein